MLSWMRRRVTYANLAMTLTLVFAMTGGAYAAKKYLITSTKQISPSVLKALAGKPGPAGPAGPAGPQGAPGAAGKDGAQGPKGDTGAEGKEGPQGKEGEEGKQGIQGIQGIQGEKGTQGEKGEPWTAGGTLPSGKTETGTYATNLTIPEEEEEGAGAASISFPIPLANAIPEASVHIAPAGKCTGSTSAPVAGAGELCIYPIEGFNSAFMFGGAKTSGGILFIIGKVNSASDGVFAVTAP